MTNNFITPLNKQELEKIFDDNSINVLNFFIKELSITIPEIIDGQEELPIYYPQEYAEQWFAQALNAKPKGSGSYPIDIIKYNEFGADIKSLTYKVSKNNKITNSLSGEASLGQKFTTDENGTSLDSLFNNHKGNKILDIWKSILTNKYKKVTDKYNIDLYFFFILRGPNDFYLTGAKINPDKINNLAVQKQSKSSVILNNCIDNKYGTSKIYKAKKRLELRLKPKSWIDDDFAIKLENKFNPYKVNLYEKSKTGSLTDYLKNKINNYDN